MPPIAPPAPPLTCAITVLATSDLHLHLCPWDYYTDMPAPGTGLTSAAGRIADLRRRLPNAVLVDNGDFLQGTPLGDALADSRPPTAERPHPMVQAMTLMRYDAVALGNHDFNHGLGFLDASLSGAGFAVLCANLIRTDGGAPVWSPWTILQRRVRCSDGRFRPLGIGLFGVLPPQVGIWDKAHLHQRAEARGIVATARQAVAQIRAAGADVVVALCHSGIGTAEGGQDPQAEHAALAVAALSGVDAVVAGHSHEIFPDPEALPMPGVDHHAGRLAGKPAVQPGFAARHLGVLHLDLACGPGGAWRCTGGHGRVLPLQAAPRRAVPVPARLRRLCDEAAADTRRYLDRPAGQIACTITSLFGLTGACTATRLIARAQRWHVERMLQDGPLGNLPVLSAAAPPRAGGRGGPRNYANLAAGPLRERDLAALCPFPNAIRALRVTGGELSAWLEHGAAVFLQVAPGSRDAPLVNPDWPFYHFDLIEGLTYEIDLSCPPSLGPGGNGGRIRNLRHQGREIDRDAEFVLATNSYRTSGGGGFPACGDPRREVLAAPTLIRSVIGGFLSMQGPYHAPHEPVWGFATMPGTSVLLDTGPAGLDHLPCPGFEPVGMGKDGFLRLRMLL